MFRKINEEKLGGATQNLVACHVHISMTAMIFYSHKQTIHKLRISKKFSLNHNTFPTFASGCLYLKFSSNQQNKISHERMRD